MRCALTQLAQGDREAGRATLRVCLPWLQDPQGKNTRQLKRLAGPVERALESEPPEAVTLLTPEIDALDRERGPLNRLP